jgi:hypothetical protein
MQNAVFSIDKAGGTLTVLQNATLTPTRGTHHAQNNETDVNIEFLQPYHVVAADALLEIYWALISAVLLPDGHLQQTNNSRIQKRCH